MSLESSSSTRTIVATSTSRIEGGNGDNLVAGTATASVSGTSPFVTIPPPGIRNQVDVANVQQTHGAGSSTNRNAVVEGNYAGTAIIARRNPIRSVRRNRDYSCQLCDARNNNEMVQCDGCDRWFHFVCVEVSEDIANVSWVCLDCKDVPLPPTSTSTPKTAQQLNPSPKKTNSVRTKSKASSSRSETRRLKELELKKLQEEFEMEKRFLERKYKVLEEYNSETSTEADDAEDNVTRIAEWLADTKLQGENFGSVMQETNSPPNTSSGPEEHQASVVVQRKQHPSIHHTNRFDQHRSGPLSQSEEQYHSCQSSTTPVDPGRQYEAHSSEAHRWQSALPQFHDKSSFFHRTISNTRFRQQEAEIPEFEQLNIHTIPSFAPETNPSAQYRYPHHVQPHFRPSFVPSKNPGINVNARVNEFAPCQHSTPMQSAHPGLGPAVTTADETFCVLNRNQIAARQAVSKDLPEFDGTLEDWPLFYSTFNSSTQMCGFTKEENMLRLRKCLKGKALEAVRCELLHPSNVVDVLSTLKMLFGRSDAIVQSIVRKIRSLPPPSMEKLETVVNFALTVKNMIATIRACEVDDFIFNASLRYELVERLPSTLKLDWARFTRNNPNPNLASFSAWLYTVAEDASAVMVASVRDQRYRSSKKDGYLNLHSESESSSSEPTETFTKPKSAVPRDPVEDQCMVCKGSCLNVTKCSRFEGLSYDSKWAIVKECKLCRKCLRKHNGSCKQQKKCGRNGCTYLHHPTIPRSIKPRRHKLLPIAFHIRKDQNQAATYIKGSPQCYSVSFQSFCTVRKRLCRPTHLSMMGLS